MGFELGPRRGVYVDIEDEMRVTGLPLSETDRRHFERLDLIYRSLCAAMFNYVPTSGHPGGSISSGRFAAALLFDAVDHDLADPLRDDADVVSYAAGHKALGLYALWALRDEIARLGAPDLLPDDVRRRLRLEDLLGFRRNPTAGTPLVARFGAKALDGHPTPATPFVRLATGASGVGLAASVGLAWGARDTYGEDAPRVHVVEGEGGMTPGRVAETLAAAGTARLDNVVLHVDWNQASIDSDLVCRVDRVPGDYVQWDPVELCYLHDWNVLYVPDGKDLQQIVAAQRRVARLGTGQPTAIVYCTIKGWRYGIEGRAAHGAGHKLCSDGFFEAMTPLLRTYGETLPSCVELGGKRCEGDCGDAVREACLWEALGVVRRALERETGMVEALAARLREARRRLDDAARRPRSDAPRVSRVYEVTSRRPEPVPEGLRLEPGATTTLRGELGRALAYLNRESGGALLVAAADLLASTSVDVAAEGFPEGYFDARANPGARLLSIGGICEDAMSGVLSGISAFGRHIGVGSSYGAFLAALGHVAARLHAIGAQARRAVIDEPYRPMILVCAHAGLKTGEDGPTHADPQPLQIVQENFPAGTAVTLTPWEPSEIWPLLSAALARRPAVLLPFVTRPAESVPDRAALGLAPAEDAVRGVYRLRAARGAADGVVVLQGSAVTLAFVSGVLPRLERDGLDLDVYHVSSAELFDASDPEERERIFPDSAAERAIGITDYTLPTLYRWVRSERGRNASLHPFSRGHFLGSGPGAVVMHEAGLDAEGQYRAVSEFVGRRAPA